MGRKSGLAASARHISVVMSRSILYILITTVSLHNPSIGHISERPTSPTSSHVSPLVRLLDSACINLP
jgi:hypothetical protein